MQRLTFSKNGEWGIQSENFLAPSETFRKVAARLYEYENTGLSPHEVEDLRGEVDYLRSELKRLSEKLLEADDISCKGCKHYHDGEYDETCEECCRAYDADYYEREEASPRWITKGHEHGFCHCSECMELSDLEHPFCPNCGAKMEGAIK